MPGRVPAPSPTRTVVPSSVRPATAASTDEPGSADEEWNDEAEGVPAQAPAPGSGGGPPRPPPRNSFCRRYAAAAATNTNGPSVVGSTLRSGLTPVPAPAASVASRPKGPAGRAPSPPGQTYRAAPSPTSAAAKMARTSSVVTPLYRRDTVQGWDVDAVCAFLRELNLPQYEAAFRREQVDGSVLLALTEQILGEDFGMSGLHRTRFLVKIGQFTK